MSKRKPTRYKAVAILAALFLLGAGAGAAGMRAYMLSSMRAEMSGPPAQSRARFRLKAMTRRLDLTDEQRDQIATIVDEAEQEREQLSEDCRPALEQLRQRTNKRIDAVLTERQRAEYELHMDRRHQRRNGHGRGRRHRRGGRD